MSISTSIVSWNPTTFATVTASSWANYTAPPATFSATAVNGTMTTSVPTPFSTPVVADDSTPYVVYSGDGTTGQGWPDQSAWLDYDTLWSVNQELLGSSCTQFGVDNDSAQEISDLGTAISTISSNSGVDPRFILAIVMQESKGCVRVPGTQGYVLNPGLMQSYQGTGTCNTGINGGAPGMVTEPCPESEIQQMVQDGTQGTGPGTTSLVYGLSQAGTTDVSQYYKAARIYNSGSIDGSGNLQDGVATHCYSSDVANRLLGWNNGQPSTCPYDG